MLYTLPVEFTHGTVFPAIFGSTAGGGGEGITFRVLGKLSPQIFEAVTEIRAEVVSVPGANVMDVVF